jgi:hypothetical protein
LSVFPHAKHAGEHAYHTADRAAQHASDGSGGLIPGLCSLLNALNHLRIYRRRRAEKHDDNCPKREAQSHMRTRCRCRANHYLVSMVDVDLLDEFRRTATPPAVSRHYRFHAARVYRSADFAVIEKVMPYEPVRRSPKPDCGAIAHDSISA